MYGSRVRRENPRQQVAVGTADSSKEPAAATKCRLSLPRVGSADMNFPGNPGKPKNSGTLMYGSRIRRENPRQQVAVGTADSSIGYAVASGCRLSLPGEGG